MPTSTRLPSLLAHAPQSLQSTPPPLPANQRICTAECTLGHGTPLAVQVAYWIGQPGEVIVEQVRCHGAVLDYAHFSDWTLANLAHQVKQQLRAAQAGAATPAEAA